MNINFLNYDCKLSFAKYGNGRTAIQLLDVTDDSVVAVATTNLPDVTIANNEVIIKDYSENEGMIAALRNAGVITNPTRFIHTGFTKVPVCALLVKPS